MKKVQVLRNLAAKIVLDMPKHSSATEALDQLGWDNLTKRRFHRLILFFKALRGLIDWDFNFIVFKTFIITTHEVEKTFVGPNHVVPEAKTVLCIKP